LGEYPADTRHAQRALPQLVAADGLVATYFSAWGGAVAVSAPGVAILSCVPGGGYAAWDGTAMAAAHVTGFAALLLSHHPLLQKRRDTERLEQRVAVLFDLIRAAAQPLAQADPLRVGAGVPGLAHVPATLASWAMDGSLLTHAVPPNAGLAASALSGAAWPGLLGQMPQMPKAGLWL
jgi:subtilisin family serine protease